MCVCVCQLTRAHIYPKPFSPAVRAEVRHPSFQSRCSNPRKVFIPHRSLRASARAHALLLCRIFLSPHLFTRAANSRRTFTALTNVRGSAEGSGKSVRMWAEPRNPPQHQDCSNISVPSPEPPICIHNPLLVSTRSQHGTRSALQY